MPQSKKQPGTHEGDISKHIPGHQKEAVKDLPGNKDTTHFPFQPAMRSYDESVQRELIDQIQSVASIRNIPTWELEGHFAYKFTGSVWVLTGEVVHKHD